MDDIAKRLYSDIYRDPCHILDVMDVDVWRVGATIIDPWETLNECLEGTMVDLDDIKFRMDDEIKLRVNFNHEHLR